MSKNKKEILFEEHIDLIEMEFLRAVPEIQNKLGEMEQPQNQNYAVFEIPMHDIIPGYNLTVAAEGKWNTRKIEITHYKMEAKDEEETVSKMRQNPTRL